MCHLPEAAAFDKHCLHDVARQIHREHPSRRCPRCGELTHLIAHQQPHGGPSDTQEPLVICCYADCRSVG